MRSTDRADLMANRLEQIAKPAGKPDGRTPSRRENPKGEKNEPDQDEQEMEALAPSESSHILDVKV